MARPVKLRMPPTCHPDRPYKAKGLCAPCYRAQHVVKRRAACHPERPHEAKGLCAECYGALRWRSDPAKRERKRLAKQKRYKESPDRFRLQSLAWKRANPARWLWLSAKCRAKANGLAFTVDASEVVIPDRCPLLGILLVMAEGGTTDSSPSLDRIDSTRGYETGNVWVISHRANRIKTDATLAELECLTANLRRKMLGEAAA